ncbi:hypothetical protein KUTeg_011134 [Tegillarca granosa]|uniref:Uncharacterized protein n=1 Tax=Tegillarca granosa TaxID=220873 RepID=A0ABQ9F1P2_TEGGR|nr:hypothetical protein KUTeg_011134 [Tegillarca granosa]
MNDLLTVSIEGPTLDDYDAELSLHRWWNHGRARRPRFGPNQGGNDDNEDDLLNFLLQNN